MKLEQIFYELNSVNNLSDAVFDNLKEENIVYLPPFHGSAKSFFVKKVFERNRKLTLLLPDKKILRETKVELDVLGLSDKLLTINNFDAETGQEKITELINREEFILLAGYDLLTKRLPSQDQIKQNTTLVETGGEISYEELIEYLNLLNYNEDKYVDVPGDFAVRGSIIDFWSYSENLPARLEFDGDFLESIRHFDAGNQRSIDVIETVSLAAQVLSPETNEADIFDFIKNSLIIVSSLGLNDLFDSKTKIKEDFEIEQEDELEEELKKELVENGTDDTEHEKVNERSRQITREEIFSKNVFWLIEEEIAEENNRLDPIFSPPPVINSNFEILFKYLKQYADNNYKIFITSENELQAKRLNDLLADYKSELRDLLDSGKLQIEVLPIKEGFLLKEEKLLVLSDYQVFNKPYRTKVASKKPIKKSHVKEFASIKRGDFVVHEYFGIGQYAGLETIKIGQIEQESIKILYAEGGIVYLNLNYLSLVKKFSSKENTPPRLSVLGSGEWKRTKKKVKTKIKDAARELIELYAKRKAAKGITYSSDTIWQKELEASFFYEDTPDQSKVTDEVKTDMENENPMDRLVCGDVGFGKTEIAVRAAFKAVNEGKQVAMLVPTTILAEQHFNTFKDRLSPFPVEVAALSRFLTKKEQQQVVKRLTEGKVDIVIGTHRLLSNDVSFKTLGLLIIDEEHRFGVMAKEKLRRFKVNVNTLTLTATPIPRTLNLSLLGARDLSIIATPPLNRQPIYTKVDKFNIHKVRSWVLHEIKRDGQIYLVHDRVQSIDKLALYVQKHIPEINIGVAHGQMKPAQLEKVIHDFLNKKFHMLISTKIIESGLDIPNVNTIVVNRADRFGLAELHQLRGRVGRSNRQAYAYFLVPSLNTITKKAVKRLQAIEEYTDLGEGFNLSMRDLEIRGAGNLLGTEQSGAIDTVGFDLYLKLLDEAVEELKQEEFKDVFKDLPQHINRTEPKIDAYFEIGIPKSFMPDQADRLSFYTALFSILKIEEITEITEEMTDRFGKIPEMVNKLILVAELRFFASYALFEKVVIKENKISLFFPKPENEEYYNEYFADIMQWITKCYPKTIRFYQKNNVMKLDWKNVFQNEEETLKQIIQFCKEIQEIMR